jgi:hypothetical protein
LAAHARSQQAVFIQRWCPDRSRHELLLGKILGAPSYLLEPAKAAFGPS